MATLGDIFPKDIREKVATRHLLPGIIIRRYCEFTTPPKYKYLFVASVTPKLLVFVINSEINEFIKKRPSMLKCQVELKKENYNFLDHDSHTNCVDVNDSIDLSRLQSELENQFGDVFQETFK